MLLDGLIIKAAKQGKSPTALCTLTGGRLEAGASVMLTKAEHWPSGKLTNGAVDMLIVDDEGKTVQTIAFSSKWFGAVADGTGVYLVAKEFGTTVTQESQWKPSVEPQDWPADPDTEITDTTTAADLGITAGALADATPAELRRLAKWAKANSVPYAGAEVNGFAFAETGYTLFEEAYLLNCAPTAEAVAAKKALFRFTEIIPGTVPSITGDFNGTVTILKATTLENGGDWAAEKVDPHFFKAMLTR